MDLNGPEWTEMESALLDPTLYRMLKTFQLLDLGPFRSIQVHSGPFKKKSIQSSSTLFQLASYAFDLSEGTH